VLQTDGNLVTRKFPWIIEKNMCPTQIGTADETLSPFTSNSAGVYAKRGWVYVAEDDWFSGLRGVNSTNLCRDPPKSISSRYLTSLYWSVVTMATVGYGDVTGSTNIEYAFITVIAVLGTLMAAGVMGFISSQIAFESANASRTDVSLKAMRKKLLASPLDTECKRELLENVQSMMQYTISEQMQVLTAFPEFYYEKLVQSLFVPHLNKCAIFDPVPLQGKEIICLSCKTYMCTAGQTILSQGCCDTSLYIIMQGAVQLSGVIPDGGTEVNYAVLGSHDPALAYFGEQVIEFFWIFWTALAVLQFEKLCCVAMCWNSERVFLAFTWLVAGCSHGDQVPVQSRCAASLHAAQLQQGAALEDER
jgi:hypothetical protein